MKPRAIMRTQPSFPFSQYQDATGPERILSFYDPASQMRAVIVIDTTAFGMSAGGVRMLPDLSVEEMIRLARAMTYKYLMLEFPAGGRKSRYLVRPGYPGPPGGPGRVSPGSSAPVRKADLLSRRGHGDIGR